MLACRPRPHRLAGFSFLSVHTSRSTSTSASFNQDQPAASSPQPADSALDSIFTAPESPWDHVFADIEPPHSTRQRRPDPTRTSNTTSPSDYETRHGQDSNPNSRQTRPFMQRRSGVRQQRASVTAREMRVFDDMFDMIFGAVSRKSGKVNAPSTVSGAPGRGSYASAHAPSTFSDQTPSIGRAGDPVNDLFRTLRRRASRVRWTTAIDEELDRRKETMELFNTDHELLQWVTFELFGETQRWNEEAKKAMASSSKEKDGGVAKADASGDASATSSIPSSRREHAINPSLYPHLIAHAMRIFRTTYSNPSLSLAIFNHAARVSIPSYVFGCTAPAYNELMEARWEGWGDLKGVCDALEEMGANGIKIDGRTRVVAERVRREVGEARPVELGGSQVEKEDGEDGHPDDAKVNPLARGVWRTLGEEEAMKLLNQMEFLALRKRPRKSTSSPHEESWKSAVLDPSKDDGWGFDEWDEKARGTKKRKGQGKADFTRQTTSLDAFQ